ncbi:MULTISPECIES: pilus assembly protein [Burkholderia]|uniref:pilus assembly protein n=1 Tax=Burkholderia TaxID=32008 RepID=UPI0005728B58|nr:MULTISPECIES: pilus assembly protein [Burkholderia]AOJ67861.1 hypothetical protein WS78_03120 [Burkholderia savannae]KVG43729.1 hypothetical protein WS77_12320 [Burkholderia sp. MSMB0265]KVG88891.1 hypothetical protein WS81_23420 [Burkholderia sp. MSMB2040]KVG93064.1 hypothetical protein WS83_10500 [Burkholderia sp. MSMB2042]KVH02201.1 hypothetical protein WS82_20980 [Burkholderia sp. MSMB2041]
MMRFAAVLRAKRVRIVRRHSVRREAAWRRERATRGSSGVALPGVLAVTASLIVMSSAWFEIAKTEIRRTTNVASRSIAFRAADAALEACADALSSGTAPFAPAGGDATTAREPDGWRQPGAFDGGGAFRPYAGWPGAAQAPSCVIEAWKLPGRPNARAYLVTARGVGAMKDTVEWLQLQVAIDSSRIERRWRRVVGRPA